MNAIEVLKRFIDEKNTLTSDGGLYVEFDEDLNKYILSKTFRNALGEVIDKYPKALLALEKEEKRKTMKIGEIISEEIERLHKEKQELKEWLEKEIQKEMKSKSMHWKLREDLLKEVLVKVGVKK